MSTTSPGLPTWRRDLTGGLRIFVDHADETAVSPQPWITLGGALALFGAVAGRRYMGPTRLRTNLYTVGIGESGSGKNHPLEMAGELLGQAGDEVRAWDTRPNSLLGYQISKSHSDRIGYDDRDDRQGTDHANEGKGYGWCRASAQGHPTLQDDASRNTAT